MIGYWEHKHTQSKLCQAHQTGGESHKPAFSTHITSICDVSWKAVSSEELLLTSFEKVGRFVSTLCGGNTPVCTL